jgi:hypothetical protein
MIENQYKYIHKRNLTLGLVHRLSMNVRIFPFVNITELTSDLKTIDNLENFISLP